MKLLVENSSITQGSVDAIARTYNVLDYRDRLMALLTKVMQNDLELSQYSKSDLHKLINQVIVEHYRGESTLKAKLVESFIEEEVTATFEVRVKNSRVDFLTINGDTKSFEIKSRLDNLQKLAKQVSDYERVFEYNYIVIDQKHFNNASKLIPEHYGVMILTENRLETFKKAEINSRLDPRIQLSLFTKRELNICFKSDSGNIEQILRTYTPEQINHIFKLTLKSKYKKRWAFILEHKNNILPIDYQFFFNHNIQPRIIYGD